MTEPVYTLGVELSAGSFTNLTTLVERGSWGSAITDIFRPPSVGHGLFELSNDNGVLSPGINSSFVPGKALKLTATHGGSEFALFFGRITDISLAGQLGKRTTLIEALDDWDRVGRVTYTTSLFLNTSVRSLFTVLMSASAVNSFSSDVITDNVDFAWYRDKNAINALHELVRNGYYELVVDGNGTYYLKDRTWSSFTTFVGNYLGNAFEMRMRLSQGTIINRMKVNAVPRQIATSIQTVAFLGAPIAIPASSHIGFWLAFKDPEEPSEDVPISSLATLTASTDYYGAANSDGTGADLTATLSVNMTAFAASAVTSIFNGGGTDAYLTRFQVRGVPISRRPPIGFQADLTSSQSKFGIRELMLENAIIQNQPFLKSLTTVVVSNRGDGVQEMKLALVNEFPDVLRNANGDSLSITETFFGPVTQWRIRSSEHQIEMVSGLQHTASYDLEKFTALPYLVLDSTAFGKLDDGRILAV